MPPLQSIETLILEEVKELRGDIRTSIDTQSRHGGRIASLEETRRKHDIDMSRFHSHDWPVLMRDIRDIKSQLNEFVTHAEHRKLVETVQHQGRIIDRLRWHVRIMTSILLLFGGVILYLGQTYYGEIVRQLAARPVIEQHATPQPKPPAASQ